MDKQAFEEEVNRGRVKNTVTIRVGDFSKLIPEGLA